MDSIRLRLAASAFFGSAALAGAQTSLESSRLADLVLSQMKEVRVTLEEVRGQLAESRREAQELRSELDAVRVALASIRTAAPGAAASPAAAPANDHPTEQEYQQVTDSRLSDLEQTKVNSGSKYRLRLSGIALFNAASTRGATDQSDLPLLAEPKDTSGSGGSLAATIRQSQVRLEVFGPEWKSGRTGGDLTLDFFGGFPSTPEGVTTGMARIRTAKITLDWQNVSVVAGQDGPFFSPRSPTSFASVAYPALSSAGNLWTWTPQISIERRWNVSESSKLSITGGVLDPLTGELPASEYDRLPTAGERSRMPAYAARLGWRTANDRSASLGAGGYYSRQNWQTGQRVDSWVATADWDLPLAPRLSLSGELYRGRAIGGLGGGPNGSVVPAGLTGVTPVDTAGGWAQLKFIPVPKIQLNGAFGEDHAFLSGARMFQSFIPMTPVRRNESAFFNVIYQPRSSLVLSMEYRRLRTVRPSGPATADHVDLGAGIIF